MQGRRILKNFKRLFLILIKKNICIIHIYIFTFTLAHFIYDSHKNIVETTNYNIERYQL